ncbi:autotransporter outer membrane beta-barrel domain-containing protein [Avibacterium paragallinarum]|uniref:autotransporter outer membrane beta-barrel domain-containing protein n=1 Tax=Avibacterium paragallinarum TaxID=728 RepID=UPI00384DD574
MSATSEAQTEPQNGKSNGYAITLYSGIHQIHQMPIFVEGALTYGKFKHLVAQQHYQQNFLVTSIESGYRYQKNNWFIVPSVQLGIQHITTPKVQVEHEGITKNVRLNRRDNAFANMQLKASYQWHSQWGDWEPNLTLEYGKTFDQSMFFNERSYELDQVRYSSQLGISYRKKDFSIQTGVKWQFSQHNDIVDKSLVVQLGYYF